MDSKITLADIQDAFINKCHLTENYFDDGKGEELFQKNFPSAQLDFVDFMRKTGAFTDEWFSTYNKACLINTYGFGKDVKMYDEVDNHIEPLLQRTFDISYHGTGKLLWLSVISGLCQLCYTLVPFKPMVHRLWF